MAEEAGQEQPSSTVMDRRAAMRAALGGAAAGAAFAAPRISGLSIIPDYAAAGTACADGPVGTSVSISGYKSSKYRGGLCARTSHAICYGGNTSDSADWCGSNWSCSNTGNYGNANDWASNGVNLSIGSYATMTYVVAGSSKQSGTGFNWSNDSRSHMQINAMDPKFNSCTANLAISCNSGTPKVEDFGTDNNNHSDANPNTNNATWSRTRNKNQAASGWSNRWRLFCQGFENNMGNNDDNVLGSTTTITFTCTCV